MYAERGVKKWEWGESSDRPGRSFLERVLENRKKTKENLKNKKNQEECWMVGKEEEEVG